jgi:hypothetical protein
MGADQLLGGEEGLVVGAADVDGVEHVLDARGNVADDGEKLCAVRDLVGDVCKDHLRASVRECGAVCGKVWPLHMVRSVYLKNKSTLSLRGSFQARQRDRVHTHTRVAIDSTLPQPDPRSSQAHLQGFGFFHEGLELWRLLGHAVD